MSWQRATFRYGTAVPLMLVVASCAAVPTPAPAPTPHPVAAAPQPVAMPSPTRAWNERALDSGAWRYDAGNRTASFEQTGNASPLLSLACTGGNITLTTGLGAAGQPLDVDLKTSAGSDRLRFTGNQLSLGSRDGRLDRIAFSRGRFALEASNGSALTLPVQAEIGRVIEDCRG